MKLYAILGASILFLAGIMGAAIWGYERGKDAEIARQQAIINKYQAKQRELVNSLEEAKQKRKIVYRTKVKTIHEAKDPTKCADTVIPQPILDQLH